MNNLQKLAVGITCSADGFLSVNGVELYLEFTGPAGQERFAAAMLSEDGSFFELTGSETGSHTLCSMASITDAYRLAAHWTGYVASCREQCSARKVA